MSSHVLITHFNIRYQFIWNDFNSLWARFSWKGAPSERSILRQPHLSGRCSPFENDYAAFWWLVTQLYLLCISININQVPTSNSVLASFRSSFLPMPTSFLHLTVLPSDFFSSTSGSLSSPFQITSPLLLPFTCSCQVVECSECRWLQERVRYAKVQSTGEEANLMLESKEERQSTLRLVVLSNKALLTSQVNQEGCMFSRCE